MRPDVTVVGAGVVGLATARALAGSRSQVLVVEQEPTFGRGASSRSSEVVHAGLYYAPGSAKAHLSVEGRRLLWALCEREGIPHERLGKLVVATDGDEAARLEALAQRARANGVDDVEILHGRAVAALEPHVRAVAALHSPSSGIVDAHALMARLAADAVEGGVLFAYRTRVIAIRREVDGFRIRTEGPDGEQEHRSRTVVNSAGLGADGVAALAGIDVRDAGYRQHLLKGEYFRLAPAKARLLRRLVYPVPREDECGLGIHATPDLAGTVRLGPDASFVSAAEASYDVDAAKRGAFARAVRPFLPFVEDDDLAPDFAGIRPRLAGPGEPDRDFVIAEEEARGLPGLVNLVGIGSPGLTAALAIARQVVRECARSRRARGSG